MVMIFDISARIITTDKLLNKYPAIRNLVRDFGKAEVDTAYGLANQMIVSAIGNAHNNYAIGDAPKLECLVKDENVYLLKILDVKESTLNEETPCVDILLEGKVRFRKVTATAALCKTANSQGCSLSAAIRSLEYLPSTKDPETAITLVAGSHLEKKLFYYYTPGECALDDFANEHILISRLGHIDDPNEWVAKFVKNGKPLSVDEVRNMIYKKFHPKYGLISVAESPNIEPMWGLYADKYKGAVLELEAYAGSLLKVDYSTKRYECDVRDFGWRFCKICSRKSKKWEFEGEYRMVFALHPEYCTPVGALMFAPMKVVDPARGGWFTLKRILCGPCMPDELFNRLRFQQWRTSIDAKKKGLKFDVEIVKMKLRQDTYELFEDKIYSADKHP